MTQNCPRCGKKLQEEILSTPFSAPRYKCTTCKLRFTHKPVIYAGDNNDLVIVGEWEDWQ